MGWGRSPASLYAGRIPWLLMLEKLYSVTYLEEQQQIMLNRWSRAEIL